jgi:hypothetical protein
VISWQRDLEGTSSPGEVVQLTRSYIAAMSREAFASLPDECRPGFISSAEDVRDWSERINEAYWRLRRASADVSQLQDIWSFFLRATVRLARFEEARALP